MTKAGQALCGMRRQKINPSSSLNGNSGNSKAGELGSRSSITMPAIKRKVLEAQLQRRVRARRTSSEEFEDYSNEPSNQIRSHNEGRKALEESQDSSQSSDDGVEDDDADTASEIESDLATSISFGALAKAQATLQRPPKHGEKPKSNNNGGKSAVEREIGQDSEALERKAGRKDHRDFSRPSKHAPAEISSKKAVSRKREVVAVIKREHRDPRFDPLSGPLDTAKLQKAYSFLDDYREDEMRELKSAIAKTRDAAEKEKLKRTLLSMESRKQTDERKRKEADILDRHRKEEKQLVKLGKKPFYLKKTEQRKRLLLDRFSELKGKQLDRALERRRKKTEGREKKKMPWSRRGHEERTA